MGTQGQINAGSEFYLRKIGQPSVSSFTKRAFLISGKEDNKSGSAGAQPQILHVFLKHKVRIVSQSGYSDERRGQLVLSLCCGMKNADTNANGLLVELRLLKFMQYSTSVSMKNHIFEEFLFPLTMLDSRVVALNPRIMFWLEERTKTPEGKAILVDVGGYTP